MELSDHNLDLNSSRYGCTREGYTECSPEHYMHYGTDLKAYNNDEIYSMYAGKVLTKGTQKDDDGNDIGWGNYIIIESIINGEVHWFLYAHLMEVPSISGNVSLGQMIGKVGTSGNSDYPHLHVEVKKPSYFGQSYNDAQFLNPEDYFASTFGSNDGSPNQCFNY